MERERHGSPRATAWLATTAVATCAALVAWLSLPVGPGDSSSEAGPGDAIARQSGAAPAHPVAVLPPAAAQALAEPIPRPTAATDRTRAATPQLPTDETDRTAREGTERAWREHYEGVAARGPGALAAAAADVFARPAQDCERVALLGVLWEHGDASAPQWFAHALAACTEHAGPASGHESVADFALNWLARRAAAEPVAGDVLGAYVRDPSPLIDAGRRRRAAAAVAEAGTREQLVRLAADLAPTDDLELLRAALCALRRNEHADEVVAVYAPLEARLPPGVLADAAAALEEDD